MKLLSIALLMTSMAVSQARASTVGEDCNLIRKSVAKANGDVRSFSSIVKVAIASCRTAPTAADVQAKLQSIKHDTSANRTVVFRELGARAAVSLLVQRYGVSIESIRWEGLSPIALGYDDIDTLISIEHLQTPYGTRKFDLSDATALVASAETMAQSPYRLGVTNEDFAYALGEMLLK